MSSDNQDLDQIEIHVVFIDGEPHVKWADVTDALLAIDSEVDGQETDTWCSSEAMEVAGSAVMAATEAPPEAKTVTVDIRTYCVEIPVVVQIQQLREIGGD